MVTSVLTVPMEAICQVNGLSKACQEKYKNRKGIHNHFWNRLEQTHSSMDKQLTKASEDHLTSEKDVYLLTSS